MSTEIRTGMNIDLTACGCRCGNAMLWTGLGGSGAQRMVVIAFLLYSRPGYNAGGWSLQCDKGVQRGLSELLLEDGQRRDNVDKGSSRMGVETRLLNCYV